MVELIIAEKPSAARKIADALADGVPKRTAEKSVSYYTLTHDGKPIIVASAVGHLYSLAERVKSKGFVYPVFDIQWTPTYSTSKTAAYTKPYVELLKKLGKKAKSFTVACDYDTEGSVIGLNALRFACGQKDGSRMKFSTLTVKDLVEAFEKRSKKLDWGQALAGETRHYLDFYYGINVSRALTSAIKAAGAFKILSTGRVQGPALKIVVDRELSIQAFDPVPYWEISLDGSVKRRKISAMHDEGKFWDEREAVRVYGVCGSQSTASVKDISAKKFTQKPPHPFDLTTLQTESYRLFKIKPKQTLQIAQTLYLASVISYPRTSSQQYPESIGYDTIMKSFVKHPKYGLLCAKLDMNALKPNNGKKKDPAHPAIFPTGQLPGELNPREMKVYDLIVKRFFATFGKPATRETVKIALDVAKEPFTAKGTRTVEREWHELYDPYVKLEEEELPAVKAGDEVKVNSIDLAAKETQPPKRYTPASLIKELEKQNLGTKATRSEIIETLYKRNYIIEDSIEATKFGIEIAKVLAEHVPKIVDPELTQQFEEDMAAVRADKKKPAQIIERARKVLIQILQEFREKEKQIGEELLKTLEQTRHDVAALGPCPKCEKGSLVIKKGKYGRFAACDKYPDCKTTIALPKSGGITALEKVCEHCKYPMIKIGARGRFQDTCLNANCPSKAPTEEIDEKPCEKCGKGKMVVRKSVYGAFLACDQYPKCRNTAKIGADDAGDENAKKLHKKSSKKATKKSANKRVSKK